MGLDTSHDCWHGSYGGFARWRNQVVQAAGFELIEDKYGPNYDLDTIYPDWTHDNIMGLWADGTPEDPLMVLLVHSDCDGAIYREHLLPLAERLEGLIPALTAIPDEYRDSQTLPEYSPEALARRFAAGLRAAHADGEIVDFH